MSSFIDMSLEDIIQKRRKENKRSKIKPQNGNFKSQAKPTTQKKIPIVDARNKIISKKRIQITDAREKLAELAKHKDARLKLEQMRKQRSAKLQLKDRNIFNRNQLPFMRTVQNKERVFLDPSRQVRSQPLHRAKMPLNRQLTTNKRNIETRSFENRSIGLKTNKFSVNVSNWKQNKNTGITRNAPLKPIVRTVENDIEIYDEPMESDIEMEPRVSLNRKASLQLKIIAHNNEPRESRSSAHRSAPVERDVSPPRPPSILKKRPMAALRTEKKVERPEKPNTEYRIIVSSLGSTVTAGDIEELFGDVGGMIESRLVRPGTAEVIYKTLEDAQRAVDLYHKRQLDGQPMNCLLVTPRTNAAPARSGNKPGLYSTNSNVEPDLSTFHKVLFSNL
ncbi:polymerase delta-interacting protein 3-like [Leguminivora glycinivorella]|uniref:polymerase delta-interacting protein 3-like n=1 Tax=Leguminivora glycinivorella TaxID=1035111 RepID=UPI00200D1015|nr:polymerase delta-interacting protein 3-like [Leguminivora glycinivorella]